jgi:hypothetical protein
MSDLHIYEIQTLHRVYDIVAANRAIALDIHHRNHPDEVVIDSKDKTAKRAHERALSTATRTEDGADDS